MASEQISGGGFWNAWRISGWGIGAGLLLLPATAMQFTGEVNWTVSDFLFMAMMISCVGLGIELAVRASRSSRYRAGAAVSLLTGFLVIWANGAVGIIGDEGDTANLLFFGVIGLAVGGAFLARFRPGGMARAAAIAAAAQLAVPLIAKARGSIPRTAEVTKTLLFNTVFAALWLLSAWLFRQASRIA
jgi:hypothetical protein